nr:alpha-glucosidase [Lachnospiraceae bacterium]
MTSDEVRDVVRKHREAGIPLDMLYLDIDYMDAYKDFTLNPQTFADFDQLVSEMKAQKIHLVPIID